MKKSTIYTLLPLLLAFVVSCRSTKYVPENSYLLDKVVIKTESKEVSQEEVKKYLRQTPNASVLGLWKLQLGVYNLSGSDTTKWINRALRKMGDAPEIYDSLSTYASAQQIEKMMQNKGYFSAKTSYEVVVKRRKAKVIYTVVPNRPHTIRKYTIDIAHPELESLASDATRSLVKVDALFDSNQLDAERIRLAQQMRRNGYYYFEKDVLGYQADSTLSTRQVDVNIELQPYVKEASDSIQKRLFTQYRVRKVVIHTDYDQATTVVNATENVDTVRYGDYLISYGAGRTIRAKTLIDNCHIVPGQLYNESMVDRTYSLLNALGPIKYVNVSFREASEDELDCYIVIASAKKQSFSVDIEGTFSAGDLGIGGNAGYVHRNIFRGAEEFSLQGRYAYEWRRKSGVATEVGADARLKFPGLLLPFVSNSFRHRMRANTQFSVTYNYQQRPQEYTRTIAGGAVRYNWNAIRSRFRHSFDLFDLSYVYLPWISDEFKNYFLSNQSILKYSYEDHLIMRWGYTGSYSDYNAARPMRNYRNIHYSVETAGNLLYGMSHLFNASKDAGGTYRVFNIHYSQYVKLYSSISYHQIFNSTSRLVYHAALGVAVPYGNATSIPFEKRFYAGGANSVRGWSVRSLGPGSYQRVGTRIDYNNQSGDIKLDLNLELRAKLFSLFDGALFVDAGNIWTIREYETQPGGHFRFDKFYEQIAVAYGAGIRADFSLFVLRVDFGVRLFDPSQERRYQWRTKPTWKNDMAFHFAIGYPF